MARSAGVISVAVIVSRILGLVREQVFAAYFGAGFLNDCFQIGLRLTSPLYDLLAVGAVSSYVALFSRSFERRDEAGAWRLVGTVMTLLCAAVSVCVVAGVWLAPLLVAAVAPGFPAEKAALAVQIARIIFPVLLPVALASAAMGLLNSKERFATTAYATAVHNVGVIVVGVSCAYWLSGGSWVAPRGAGVVPGAAAQRAITGMAFGVLAGGLLQLLLQVPALARIRFRARPRLALRDAGVRLWGRLMWPVVVGAAAVQVNLLVSVAFASRIPGGPSWLDFAFKLVQLPVGIFGVAVGVATLPPIAKAAARGDFGEFSSTLSSSLRIVLLSASPAAVALFVLARPVTALAYQRGAFTPLDTNMVAAALAAMSVGLVGSAAAQLLLPAFYALEDWRTPVAISACSVVLNAAGSHLFGTIFSSISVTPDHPHGYGHAGIALAASCVSLFTFAVAARRLSRRVAEFRLKPVLTFALRLAPALAALAAVVYGSHALLAARVPAGGHASHAALALVPLAAGAAVYVWAASALKLFDARRLLRAAASGLPLKMWWEAARAGKAK